MKVREAHHEIERQRLGIPVESLSGERAAEVLVVGEDRQPPLAGVLRSESAADRPGTGPRLVELERRAVTALFVEVGAGDEQRRLRRSHQLGPAVEGRMARLGLDVDRATPRLLHDAVALGVEVAALEREPERSLYLVQQEIEVHGVAGTVASIEEHRALGGPPREDVDDATEGIVAPGARAAAPDDLDLLDALQRDAVPVDPAAERVVDRHSVHQHERPAGAARSDAAQREPLRRRMRDKARRAAEQAEARHLPEEVVEGLARREADVVARQDRHAGGRLAGLLLDARHRDHDRLEGRGIVGGLRRRWRGGEKAEEQRREAPGHLAEDVRHPRASMLHTGPSLDKPEAQTYRPGREVKCHRILLRPAPQRGGPSCCASL